mgnify:CR=1 FL=1
MYMASSDLKSLFFGIIAAVIATIVWSYSVILTNFQFGLISAAVGFIVGIGVSMGQKNPKPSLIVLSIVLTLLSLAVSQFLIVRHIVNQNSLSFMQIPLIVDPSIFLDVVVRSIQIEPITLLFWGISLYLAYAVVAGIGKKDEAKENLAKK